MSIVNTLDVVAEWIKKEVCRGWKLKAPTKSEQTDRYDYQLMEPNVYALYEPTNSDRPPSKKPLVPAICIQLVNGSDAIVEGRRSYKIRLSFSTYQPGIHDADVFYPKHTKDGTRVYRRGRKKTFQYSEDGWRDLWNLIDRTIRKIEDANAIGTLALDKPQGISFGVFSYQDEMPDLYPFWLGWVELTITEQFSRNNGYSQFL